MNGPELRIGDDDRESAVTALGDHYAAGRLTREEYDERAERAWAARTASQLRPLFADLPGPQAPARAVQPGPARLVPGRGHAGWWTAAWTGPLLLVVAGLVVLTHLPLFLLLLLAWFLVVRSGRHAARRRHPPQWSGPQDRTWVR